MRPNHAIQQLLSYLVAEKIAINERLQTLAAQEDILKKLLKLAEEPEDAAVTVEESPRNG